MIIEIIIECSYCGKMLLVSHKKFVMVVNNFHNHNVNSNKLDCEKIKKIIFYCGDCRHKINSYPIELFDEKNNQNIMLYCIS